MFLSIHDVKEPQRILRGIMLYFNLSALHSSVMLGKGLEGLPDKSVLSTTMYFIMCWEEIHHDMKSNY